MKLLLAYPAAWRARYGDELLALLAELDGAARMSWRVRLDVVRGGVVERLRSLAAGGRSPEERVRRGSVLVLYAWMLFVLGGFGIEKAAEHWRAATPSGDRLLPSAAFDVLVGAAVAGGALVLLGIALTLPGLLRLLRGGGWARIRVPILVAAALGAATVLATAGLAAWSHSLTPAARNGHDPAYTGAFGAWVLLFAVCLFACARAAAVTARQLSLPTWLLRLEARLAAGTSAAMVATTLAAAAWWGGVASAAPWFFAGRPAGSRGSAVVAYVVVPVALMVAGSVAGLVGARRATRALAALGG